MSQVVLYALSNFRGIVVDTPSGRAYSIERGQVISSDAEDVALLLTYGCEIAPGVNPSGLTTTTKSLSSADLLSLFSNPFVIVPSPGPNKVVFIVSCVCALKFGTTSYTTTDDTIGLYWGGGTIGDILTQQVPGIFQESEDIFTVLPPIYTSGSPLFDADQPLTLSSQVSDMIDGDGTGSVTAVWYIITLP